MNNEDKIVVYAADKRLYKYLPISIGSLLNNNPNVKVKLFIEDDDLEICHHPRVEIFNINNYKNYIDKNSPSLLSPLGQRLSRFTFLRLYLSKILTDEKILWLDVDTIITDNIEELFSLNLGKNIIGGVIDEGVRRYLPPFSHLYVNAGVLIMDLNKIRESKLDDEWLHLINTQKLQFLDQDAINFTAHKFIKPLNITYNCGNHAPVQCQYCMNPKIIHFAASLKLWDNPYYDLIKKYAIDDLKEVKK